MNKDIGKIEGTGVDYKLELETEKPKSWLKSVSAFANTNGGHILFGVTNNTHEKRGLEDPQYVASKISELIGARITPAPRYILTEFDSDIQGKVCIDLEIQNGPNYPYYYDYSGVKEAFIRHGDRSEKAQDHELNSLILKGQNRTFDSLPTEKTLDDVSFTLFSATYKQECQEVIESPRDLISMGIVDEDEHVTNAGLLLCDQGPLAQSRIICTRWKGNSKGSIEGDALDDKEFSGESLISLLRNAETFIRNNSKNPWTIRGMRREEQSDYPYRAVREVLINAMMHRDYQIVGSEIHVDMFDDRLEIVSPGGMVSGRKIQECDLRHVPSLRRNEIIADFFGRLKFMDRRGSGIGRILDSYEGFIEQPVFTSDTSFFFVSLPNRSKAKPNQMELEDYAAGKNIQLKGENVQLGSENIQLNPGGMNPAKSEKDWEMAYFLDVVMPEYEKRFRKKSVEQLKLLFDRYRYEYAFNRRVIAELFEITENGASAIIKKCLKLGLFTQEKVDVYYFAEHKE